MNSNPRRRQIIIIKTTRFTTPVAALPAVTTAVMTVISDVIKPEIGEIILLFFVN